jgi:UrcA family protein
MNFSNKIPHRSPCDAPYGKLASMALCSLMMIAMIGKQLPAHAADRSSTTVSLADLDLRTEKGMQAARERLHQAARMVCYRVVDLGSLSHHADYLACIDDTMAAALAKITGPSLAANAKPQASAHGAP